MNHPKGELTNSRKIYYFVSYICNKGGMVAYGHACFPFDGPITGPAEIQAMEDWLREHERVKKPVILFWRRYELPVEELN